MDAAIRVRIDADTKEKASAILQEIGLSMSDVCRMALRRVVADHALPFDLKVPNEKTRAAMAELEAGGGKRFASVVDLMADLRADD